MVIKKYKIIISKNALVDLKEIIEFIKQHSPDNAKLVKEKIISIIESLETFPYKYHIDTFHPFSYTTKDYRYATIWSFQIHYKIEKNKVFILKIIYGGKNPSKISDEIKDIEQ